MALVLRFTGTSCKWVQHLSCVWEVQMMLGSVSSPLMNSVPSPSPQSSKRLPGFAFNFANTQLQPGAYYMQYDANRKLKVVLLESSMPHDCSKMFHHAIRTTCYFFIYPRNDYHPHSPSFERYGTFEKSRCHFHPLLDIRHSN